MCCVYTAPRLLVRISRHTFFFPLKFSHRWQIGEALCNQRRTEVQTYIAAYQVVKIRVSLHHWCSVLSNFSWRQKFLLRLILISVLIGFCSATCSYRYGGPWRLTLFYGIQYSLIQKNYELCCKLRVMRSSVNRLAWDADYRWTWMTRFKIKLTRNDRQ